jgi:hypothetical protein
MINSEVKILVNHTISLNIIIVISSSDFYKINHKISNHNTSAMY